MIDLNHNRPANGGELSEVNHVRFHNTIKIKIIL